MSHIKTAQELGVQKALKEAGYSSIDDVRKQAEALGLLDKEAAPTNPVAGIVAHLGKR